MTNLSKTPYRCVTYMKIKPLFIGPIQNSASSASFFRTKIFIGLPPGLDVECKKSN